MLIYPEVMTMGRKGGFHQQSIPQRILDILETDGDWMTAESLVSEISIRFDEVTVKAVARAMRRLVVAERIEERSVLFLNYDTPHDMPLGYVTNQVVEVKERIET